MADRIQCPACGRDQAAATDSCRKCGIVFSRYGAARSLFTARRTQAQGKKSPRADLTELRPSWRTVLLAMAFGVLGGYAIWFDAGDEEEAPAAAAEVVAVEAADVAPAEEVTHAPGLTADQLNWGLVDTWRAPGADGENENDGEHENENEDEPPPEDDDAGARPIEIAPPAAPPAPGDRPAEGSSVRPPRGETSAPYSARAGSSLNERFDPVGSRGWYEGIDGYERALVERDRRNATLVVYFHAPWCSWCARFRNEYLSHRAMKDFLDRVVRVHIDPENSEPEAELATLFGVRAFPSFYVVPAGTERPERLHPFLGDYEIPPEEFADRAAYVARGVVFPFDEPDVLSFEGVKPFGYDLDPRRDRRRRHGSR